MIDVVILCPLSIEYSAVRRHISHLAAQKDAYFGLPYESGKVKIKGGEIKVAILETGGKIGNLQEKTTQVAYSLNPTYLFLVGIAAGIKDVVIGDVVVGTKAYGYEGGKESRDGFLSRPDTVEYSKILINEARQLVREDNKESYAVKFGPIASGNKVINNNTGVLTIIKKHYNDTLALEMESIGFATAAASTDLMFLNIRGIADLARNKKDDYQALAAQRAADFTFQLIKRLPKLALRKKVELIPVYYTRNRYKKVKIRPLKSTVLQLTKNGLIFEAGGRLFNISHLKEVGHTKMSGDIAKNWIYVNITDEYTFFFSQKTWRHGIDNLLGGNKELLMKLQKYVIPLRIVLIVIIF